MRIQPRLSLIIPFLVCAALSAPAWAQDQIVTVLSFDDPSGGDDLGAHMYDTLRTQIEFHPDFLLNDVPEQSLDDLLLVLGCSTLDADCSVLVMDIVGSDLLAWGEIYSDNSVASVRMVLFDLAAGEEVRATSHTVASGRDGLREHAALLGRSILYDDTAAALTIETEVEGAEVFINGESHGTAPVTIEDIPLGLFTVRLSAEGYADTTEIVGADVGGSDYTLGMTSVATARAPRSNDRDSGGNGGSSIGPYAVMGGGGALLIGGIIAGVQANSTQSQFDDEVSQPVFDLAEAEDLRDKGQSQATLANVLTITGGVALAGGIIWYILDQGGESASADGSDASAQRDRRWTLNPSAGPQGGHVEFQMRW